MIDRKINYYLLTFYIFLHLIGDSVSFCDPQKKAWILSIGSSSKLILFQGLFQS